MKWVWCLILALLVSKKTLDVSVVLGGWWVVLNLWFDLVWVYDLVVVLIVEVVGSLLRLNLFLG